MNNYYNKQNNSKIIIYAVLLALIIGIGAIIVQDIQAPTEHVTQDIEVTLEK